jgi:hypothetical protein
MRNKTNLIKYILLHNFWSFLLVLSGIIDITVGVVLFFGDWLSPEIASWKIFLICFSVGVFYLAAGVLIAVVQRRKKNQ